jgi:hypothetical protein
MESNKNDSKQLWLAAVMFFNIMVKNFLKNNEGEFSQEDKLFVESYIQYWYLSIISWFITIILVVLYYFYPSTILYWIHTLSIITTLAIIVVWSIGVLSWSILYHREGMQYTPINEEKDKIILYFIPIYNIFVRYHTHQFAQPNKRVKESLFMWTIWTIIGLGQNQIFLIFRTILILIRAITIAAGIDIIQDRLKNVLQQAFTVNPEEIRAYCIATIDFIKQKIQQKIIQPSRRELVQGYQKTYSYLHPIDTTIIIQYSIGWLFIVVRSRSIYQSHNTILYLPLLIILGRYIIMYKKRKHLPPLPLAREIHLFIENFYNRIAKK